MGHTPDCCVRYQFLVDLAFYLRLDILLCTRAETYADQSIRITHNGTTLWIKRMANPERLPVS